MVNYKITNNHILSDTRIPLLLGWPTLWRQINHLAGEGHRVKVGVRQTTAIMEPSLTGEMPHTILTFVTLK